MPRESGHVFVIVCESCGARIHVDGERRSVFYTEKKGMKKRSFEEVVEDVTSVGARAEEKFKKSLDKEKHSKEHLDQVFKKAKEKAEKDPNKRPPSIFDYD
ncbi:MAG: hypothetical protein ACE5GW_04375 [Planctomycetota bacterium]